MWGRMMYRTSSPTAIPCGADAVITISATEKNERTGCLPNNQIPQLNFFDYYDPLGQLAFADQFLISQYTNRPGCAVPHMTYITQTNSTPPMCSVEFVAFGRTYEASMAEMHSVTKKQDASYEESNSVSNSSLW